VSGDDRDRDVVERIDKGRGCSIPSGHVNHYIGVDQVRPMVRSVRAPRADSRISAGIVIALCACHHRGKLRNARSYRGHPEANTMLA
jgi:hypothetical protein